MGFKGVCITWTSLHDAGITIFYHVNYIACSRLSRIARTLQCRTQVGPEGHVPPKEAKSDPGLQMMGFKIPYSRVVDDITLMYPPKQNLETRDLSPVPRLWGWNVAKMSKMCISSFLLWLALQIPCSLAAKLIAGPPPPTRLRN